VIVLAFDCATGPISVVLWQDGRILARGDDPRLQGQAESLVPMIGAVLDQAGLRPADIDRIGVTLGPGSFTGVRISLAAARGLALATGAPIFGASTLEILAAALPAAARPTLAALDAGRGEVYAQLFGPAGTPLGEPAAVALPVVASLVPAGRLRLAGSGAALVAAALHRDDLDLEPSALPDAAALAQWVASRPPPVASAPAPEPIYLRAPDAKLPAAP